MPKGDTRLKLPDDFLGTLRILAQTQPPPKRAKAKRRTTKKRGKRRRG